MKFEHATGYKQADNVATYDTKTFEGAYLAGIVAGGMIGLLGSSLSVGRHLRKV